MLALMQRAELVPTGSAGGRRPSWCGIGTTSAFRGTRPSEPLFSFDTVASTARESLAFRRGNVIETPPAKFRPRRRLGATNTDLDRACRPSDATR
jgi:hypothetical protein